MRSRDKGQQHVKGYDEGREVDAGMGVQGWGCRGREGGGGQDYGAAGALGWGVEAGQLMYGGTGASSKTFRDRGYQENRAMLADK